MTATDWLLLAGKLGVVFGVVLGLAAYSTLAERKISAWIQNRIGPNRVGPWGLLQPLADGLKFFFKEEIVPDGANPLLFRLAPALAAGPALMTMAVIPITFPVLIGGTRYAMSIADIPIAVIFVLAMGSLGVYGILLGGWASNSKYSLLGGLRSSAQMISYELSMFLAVVAVLLLSGLGADYVSEDPGRIVTSMNLTAIFESQASLWHVFRFPVGTIAFVMFLIAAFAETNRHPFDLAECETELVGGFHTEYSSMKFALFFIGEYAAMVTMSALLTTLFLGGPTLFGIVEGIENTWLRAGVGFGVFMAKLLFFQFLFIWVRWSIPRFRWDQLMHLGWKVLLPIGILNVVATGAGIVWGVF